MEFIDFEIPTVTLGIIAFDYNIFKKEKYKQKNINRLREFTAWSIMTDFKVNIDF